MHYFLLLKQLLIEYLENNILITVQEQKLQDRIQGGSNLNGEFMW